MLDMTKEKEAEKPLAETKAEVRVPKAQAVDPVYTISEFCDLKGISGISRWALLKKYNAAESLTAKAWIVKVGNSINLK